MNYIGSILFILTFALGGCLQDNDNEEKMQNNLQSSESTAREELSYLALGDSYTIGESVDPSMRWPVQLVERLRNDSLNVNDAEIIARTGWTTGELLGGIDVADPGNNYDLVSLLIGVNNQYRGLPLSNFRTEFRQLLNISVDKAGGDKGKVIVLSIPDWGVMPFAGDRDRNEIAKEINSFNDVIKEECGQAGIRFFDITGISRQAKDDAGLVASDGLHPSGEMYKLWVHRVYPAVLDIL
ncbi:MAG: SGNH/GDSL hydrolase family protein [Bacteroidales bacterium]|nr:SGNH/GDSL hydrolase family protein [Bacteroidales bacterium]